MKHKKIVIASILIIIMSTIATIYGSMNQYTLKETEYIIELGESLSEEVADYVSASDEKIAESTLDLSQVDFTKVGMYGASITYKDEVYVFAVEIIDTTKPELIFAEEADRTYTLDKETTEISFHEILVDIIELSEVISIEVTCEETVIASGSDLEEMSLTFENTGEQTLLITVTDSSENISEETIIITIGKDYLSYIEGMEDFSMEEGTALDSHLSNITYSEEVKEISMLEEAVDINTPGTYELTYQITGDDDSITETSVTVTVVEKEVEEVEETEESTSSSSTSSSNNTSSSSSSNSSSSNSSSSSSSNSSSSNSSSSNSSSSSSNNSSSSSSDSSSDSSSSSSDSSSSSEKEETEAYWGSFTSHTLYMTSEDKAACDAIAKAYFTGQISMSSCESQLKEYMVKYVLEGYASSGFFIRGDGESNNATVNYYIYIYYAQQWYYKADGTIVAYLVQI